MCFNGHSLVLAHGHKVSTKIFFKNIKMQLCSTLTPSTITFNESTTRLSFKNVINPANPVTQGGPRQEAIQCAFIDS